ncbi:MAG: hypothetical protein ABR600_11530 [Actinomycetota bacterium]
MAIVLGIVSMVLTSTVASAGGSGSSGTEVAAEGAFTCDFQIPATYPPDRIAPVIERDRIYMTRRPGMLSKHLPLGPDAEGGDPWSGGRYLFDTYQHARDYLDWVTNSFILDGGHFLDRPYFLHPDCHAWRTFGAHDFAPVETSRAVMRTERWSMGGVSIRKRLADTWPQILDTAARRGLSAVWLLYSEPDQMVDLVYFAGHSVAGSPDALDLPALVGLENSPSLGASLGGPGWTRTQDLTEWVLTIWFPNPGPTGDNGSPSLWPNSPPLPTPSALDGVCEPSRGENHGNAPGDCTPKCGDGVWDADENNRSCPSDVPAF